MDRRCFCKNFSFFFIFILGLARFLNIKSYKDLIIPGGVLLITYSMVFSRNIMEEMYFISFIKPFLFPYVWFLMPLLLLFISTLKKKLM